MCNMADWLISTILYIFLAVLKIGGPICNVHVGNDFTLSHSITFCEKGSFAKPVSEIKQQHDHSIQTFLYGLTAAIFICNAMLICLLG